MCSNTWACGRHFTPKPYISFAETLLKEEKELGVITCTCDPSIWEIETGEVQGHPQQVSELKASQGYRRPVSNREGQGYGKLVRWLREDTLSNQEDQSSDPSIHMVTWGFCIHP